MSLLNDGINIATFLGIPKKVIVWAVACLLSLGGCVYVTYYATCAYKEHRANLDDLRTMLTIQREIRDDMNRFNLSIQGRMSATEKAVLDMSVVIERTNNDQMDILSELVNDRDKTLLRPVFIEKQKHITETNSDYLPHLNGFKIGVTPLSD